MKAKPLDFIYYFLTISLLYFILLHNSCLSYAQNNVTHKLNDFDSLVQEKLISKPKVGLLFTCKNGDTLYILQYFSLFKKIEMIPIAVLKEQHVGKSFYLGGEVEYVQNRTNLMISTLKSIDIDSLDTLYEIEQKLIESKFHHLRRNQNLEVNFMTRILYYSSTKALYNIIYDSEEKKYINNLCWFYREGDFYNSYKIDTECN